MISEGKVKRNAFHAEGIYEMVIETGVCGNFIPGQFINIYLDDKSLLLPRPISICDGKSDSVTIVYRTVGKGTSHLATYPVNKRIKISGPLGNGYDIKDDYSGMSVALIGGGVGIPPLVGLAKVLKERNASVHVFLGFASEVFLTGKFGPLSKNVNIATDDGNAGFHGNAAELLKADGRVYDDYFACGPKAMLKSMCEYAEVVGRDIQVSVEERMGCGYGACVGCTCKVIENGEIVRKKVCSHGPVFWGKELVWD